RMLDHYLHSAQDTARLLSEAWDRLPVTEAQPGVEPERFADKAQAAGWLQAEYQVLLGCIEDAASVGFERHAWQLARTLSSYFERSGHWRDWLRAQQAAVEAALRAGDLPGQAHSRHQLGYVLAHLGDHGPAHAELDRALALFGDLGDDTQRALVHLSIGYTFDHQGADDEALSQARKALCLYRSAGHRLGEGVTLNNIGWSLA